MPSKRTPEGEFRDIAHPINAGTRKKFKKQFLCVSFKYEVEEEVEEPTV